MPKDPLRRAVAAFLRTAEEAPEPRDALEALERAARREDLV